MNLGNIWDWDVVGEVALCMVLAAIFFVAGGIVTWIVGSVLRAIDNKSWDAISAILTVGLGFALTFRAYDALFSDGLGTDATIIAFALVMAVSMVISFVILGFIADFASDINQRLKLRSTALAWLPE